MKTLRVLLTIFAGSAFLAGCGSGGSGVNNDDRKAEPPEATFKDFGDYVVHFNGISTDQLQPNVASEYKIVRSKNRALLTVSIIKKEEGTIGMSVPGDVKASANNLTGQAKDMTLRPIQEGEAFYYIGDVPVANAETLVFNIAATPANETQPLEVRFFRQFFVD